MSTSIFSFFKRIIKGSVFYVVYKRTKGDYYNSAESFVLSKYIDKSLSDKKRIMKSLKRCYKYGGVYYVDYWRMHFEDSSFLDKINFVPRCAQMNLYWQVNPKHKYGPLLENKGKCYELFGKYYKRDVLYVSQEDIGQELTLERMSAFMNKHPRFIVKPLWGSCGKGIIICDSTSVNADELLSRYSKGFVLEELIIQDSIMSSLHSSSVNTVRIITVNYGNEIEVKWPFLRVGRGESIVDNAGSGGMILPIDVFSGLTIAAGDESCHSFQAHPDSGGAIIGFKIPQWDDLCHIVKEMAMICPDCHILGWDMAYSDKGWIVVECNYGPDLVFQYVVGGVRKEFTTVRRRLHAKRFLLLK